MPAGAPRTVSPPPEEMIKLGEEMIEWVKENKPLHLSQWYSFEKKYTEKQWDTMTNREEFIPYYEEALKRVGLQYIDKTSNIRDGIAHRWLRVYFKDFKRAEDEKLEYEASLKKETESYSDEAMQGMREIMNQLKGLQSNSE